MLGRCSARALPLGDDPVRRVRVASFSPALGRIICRFTLHGGLPASEPNNCLQAIGIRYQTAEQLFGWSKYRPKGRFKTALKPLFLPAKTGWLLGLTPCELAFSDQMLDGFVAAKR